MYYMVGNDELLQLESVQQVTVDSGEFALRQGYDKEIIISNLVFKNNNQEISVSGFNVLYAKKDTNNWQDATSSLTKYTDRKDNKVKYKFPVNEYSEYKVKISLENNKDIDENNVDVHFKGNAPKLSEGMIPIIFNTASKKWEVTEVTDPDWFDYTKKVWANVMLSDGTYKQSTVNVGTTVQDNELGSMFTWIPRYAYTINEFRVAKNGEGTTQNIFNVSLILNTTNSDQNNASYGTDYNIDNVQTGNPTPKIVHPGFTFGGNQLAGFWTAKFEASMAEQNNNTEENNNVTTKTIKIMPNADSWRYINTGNSFLNCLNMKNNTIYGLSGNADTHLIKNIEWGAVAYLASSQYGTTPTVNNSGEDYTENGFTKTHAYTGGKDYIANKQQSTTGNETGIYDMSGGNWERVAAYWDNGNGNLSLHGTSAIFPSNTLNPIYTKYWDKYEVSENEVLEMNNGLWNKDASANSIRKAITDEKYTLMKNKKGDAMYETINTYSFYGKDSNNYYTWLLTISDTSSNHGRSYYNSDLVLFGNCDMVFIYRGGGWNEGSMSGIFDCGGDLGASNTSIFGFRPTLVVE